MLVVVGPLIPATMELFFLGICNDLHVKHVKACYVTNIFMSGRYIRVEWTLFCKLTMFVTRF